MQPNHKDSINLRHIAMRSWDDEKLLLWFKTGNTGSEKAMGVLLGRYRPWIMRRCLFRLGNMHDAEDATQEVSIRAFNSIDTFQGRSTFRTWLSTVSDNYCNTYAQRRSKYYTCDHFDQLIELHLQSINEVNHNDNIDFELVNQILARLPENAREIINLRYVNGFSLIEMSNKLCLTLSATKARLYRAIEQFKLIYVRQSDILY